jgi:hypothetical protein
VLSRERRPRLPHRKSVSVALRRAISESCVRLSVNVQCGRVEDRMLMTGLHSGSSSCVMEVHVTHSTLFTAVCDIRCETCEEVLGWKYVSCIETIAQSHSDNRATYRNMHMKIRRSIKWVASSSRRRKFVLRPSHYSCLPCTYCLCFIRSCGLVFICAPGMLSNAPFDMPNTSIVHPRSMQRKPECKNT